MERTEILSLFKNTPADGTEITVCGWAKNIRDSKNIGFIALSDGGCFKTLQVVLEAGKLENYDAVIHICVGSKFSSCCQNAKLAAQEFGNVSVVDSENICTGQGYLVLRAAKLAADGLPPRNICMRLQALAKKVDLSFVLNQLDYMAKSGRCSGVLAFGANILGIKPSLAVIDGELKVVKKYRGQLPICVGKYITEKLADRDDIDTSVVFLSSCQPKPGCLEAVKAGLAQYGKFEQIIETDIGTTIGGYSGPGTIGIVFATK